MSSPNSPCAACKSLRRKCTRECVFAPYFPPDNPQRFECVHRVFGASNVTKLLKELSATQRDDAVKSLAYEAEARIRDPVYGCVGFISVLQHRLRQIQTDLYNAKKELASYISPQAMQVLLANPGMLSSSGVLMPHLHQSVFNNFGDNNVPQPVLVGHGGGQLMIRDSQQQEFLQAQQLAADREQQHQHPYQQQVLLRNYEQQEEFMKFNNGLEHVGVFGNQMGGTGGELSPSLALGTFENVAPYQMQQQQQGEHHVPHSHLHPIEAQLLLSPQHQHTQQSQLHSEITEDTRSIGPS
ncbi:protein ASYMMETRIC LEAVES 2-like [Abrus precatorius]|uniref:Protein ASYMMETRIC LEAVES 2-like n=1 Tax=Abrus precatorius TaxID=3816 RepID=A0A8B8KRS1_ABRPR|nr:protein ASYMMETRIC LEAVES 2-like [Abrus precatorius]